MVEARLELSCFSCPSRAIPRRSLLLEMDGFRYSTFCKLEPGWTGQPSLKIKTKLSSLSKILKTEKSLRGFNLGDAAAELAILED